MAEHFTIDMLPAFDGDALLVEWGSDAERHRMLIDGGRGGQTLNDPLTQAFASRNADEHHFALLVNTHMDADHIAGVIGLLQDAPPTFTVDNIWFNAFRHLPPDDVLGWKQSDQLECLVEHHVAEHATTWNLHFGDGGAIALPDREDGVTPVAPPTIGLHGMSITLLSPTLDRLRQVAKKWPAAVRKARLDVPPEGELPDGSTIDDEPNDILGYDEDKGVEPSVLAARSYEADGSAANGSSIAFLAQFAGKRVLFAGDAHAEVLQDTLRRIQPSGKISLDAVKLAHHASEKNLSPDLLSMVDCPNWLVSTNGNLHNHPDRRAIARLITRNTPTHLVFNYHSDETKEWARASRQMEYGFTSHHPPDDQPGVRYDVIAGKSEPLPLPPT